MNEILSVKNLCKTYYVNKIQNNVLKNINFKLNKGDFATIMGPSGSGKSTLLYNVSGMDNLTEGTVLLGNENISEKKGNALSDLRMNKMGFVFQQMNMLKSLSVYDNIIISAYNSKLGKTKTGRKEINERALMLMRKLGIIDIADNDINEVSGGQLQRACICRALINKPEIIFADEPTGSLNSKASNEVIAEFNKINEEGTTILLVTHSIKVASKTKKVIFIMDGIIKGELDLGKYNINEERERERKLSGWLMEMGW